MSAISWVGEFEIGAVTASVLAAVVVKADVATMVLLYTETRNEIK